MSADKRLHFCQINSRRRPPELAAREPDPFTRVPSRLATTAARRHIFRPWALPFSARTQRHEQPFALRPVCSFTAAVHVSMGFRQNVRPRGNKAQAFGGRNSLSFVPRYRARATLNILPPSLKIAKCRDVFAGDLPRIVQPCRSAHQGLRISQRPPRAGGSAK